MNQNDLVGHGSCSGRLVREMSVAYTAVLPVRDETVDFLAGLLAAERLRLGARSAIRSLSVGDQAVLVLRWFMDGTRMRQLAHDNRIGKSTGYDYLHEGIDVLAARSPGLHGALLAAKAADYGHVSIDGTLIAPDRVRVPRAATIPTSAPSCRSPRTWSPGPAKPGWCVGRWWPTVSTEITTTCAPNCARPGGVV